MLTILASNRFTLLLLCYLAVSIIIFYQQPLPGRYWLIALPVGLLIINFLVALALRKVLINKIPLMLFHFSLVALAILFALANMTYLKATLELATMEEFSGQLENVTAGPWHDYKLDELHFMNLGFVVNYHKGIKRDSTVNRVALVANNGSSEILEIGDHIPLVHGHYRIYTSHNKGYAPIFTWTASGSNQSITGSVHLPSYPINEYRQALEWKIPDSEQSIWTMIHIDENVLPEDRDFSFKIPQQHRLIIRYHDQRYELKPGDKLDLGSGILQYQGLTSWMGYRVDYDWTRPWLLATTLLAIASLFFHFIGKFRLLPNY